MKCTVEKMDYPFADGMFFFDMELPYPWEEFVSDFKETIGHEKNTKYSYFSGPPKTPKKGWYLCKARAEKARHWILLNYEDVIWCGEVLQASTWRQEKTEWDNKRKSQSKSKSVNDFIFSGSNPEIDFMQAVVGNGDASKDIKIKVIKSIYKSSALIIHPDKGGDKEWMQRINVAYENIMNQLGESK